MAMDVSTATLHDGIRNVVVRLNGYCNGGGSETNVVKVDASELTPAADGGLKVKKITYDVGGPGFVRLLWQADSPVEFQTLAGSGYYDYCRFGALRNNGGSGANGDILLSTIGFDDGSTYSITIEMVKS